MMMGICAGVIGGGGGKMDVGRHVRVGGKAWGV